MVDSFSQRKKYLNHGLGVEQSYVFVQQTQEQNDPLVSRRGRHSTYCRFGVYHEQLFIHSD
ncbi:hypothetical protein EMIT07CA2_90213 [Brevibacillus sp. IT-7CA2]